ncbi:major capsid protein [Rhodoferax ferrireducens]|uniref:major capsid protein n=1 Tax=Rhodoferax ferrireducens TaxID=192843 RepID=UPI000E0D0B0D|nr:major capsid protein [Rhodoferax ferrireducens]
MNKNIIRGLVAAGVLATVGAANAALPTEAATAITTAGTDLLSAIGMVIASMVAVWGLRKLGQKMGWL